MSSPISHRTERLVVGITGASGVILGIRLLEMLRPTPIESHLVVSPAARVTIAQETGWKVSDVLSLADVVYDHRDIGAALASGSFITRGMVIIPCSIKTLSGVANSFADDLIVARRRRDHERRSPTAAGRARTPLHRGHLRLLEQAAERRRYHFPAGASVLRPAAECARHR